jgi:fructose-1,6-bisphosphatase/inositol monophosphatase family enzyme
VETTRASAPGTTCHDGVVSLPKNVITEDLSKAVLAAMTRAADAEILPRWRSLSADEIRTKSHDWDLVTDADVEAEKLLTASLRDLLDITVVGEEATAAHPALLDQVGTGEPCWVVDPVDGTRNFVAGEETFACMIALIDGGRTQAAWITYPTNGGEMHAIRGVGAYLDGTRIVTPAPPRPDALRGAISAVYTGKGADDALLDRASALGPASPIRFCAGWDYLDIVTGLTDYTSFTRTLPWDHAPGALIAQEAGLRSARFDGSEYLPGDAGDGILTAHPSVWQRVSDVFAQLTPTA